MDHNGPNKPPPINDIILYDGICGMCNGFNRFVLMRDTHDHFRFASLQSRFAGNLLARYGIRAADLDTVYVVVDYAQTTEHLLTKAHAVLHVMGIIGGFWKSFIALKTVPAFLLNHAYDFIASRRYRIFGKYDTCPLPSPKDRAKFIEV